MLATIFAETLAAVCGASEAGELELRNLEEARGALVRAGRDVVYHKQEVAQLLERYRAVEELCVKKEESLTTKINDVLSREQALQSQRTATEVTLQRERNELSRHERNLESARERHEEASRKHEARVALSVGSAVLGLFTFGLAAPLTMAAAGGAIGFAAAANEAKMDMKRIEREISDKKGKVRSSESTVSSLSSSLSQLSSEQKRYRNERSCLDNEKGKVKKMIVFLLDAQAFGEEYRMAIETCSTQTALANRLVDRIEKKGYSLFDSRGTEIILTSFNQAWAAFREMRERQSDYVFKVEFDCTLCGCHRYEFPHVSSGQLSCATCFTPD